jgi:hypothetical protein
MTFAPSLRSASITFAWTPRLNGHVSDPSPNVLASMPTTATLSGWGCSPRIAKRRSTVSSSIRRSASVAWQA